jgi:hypothetical protein
MSLINEVSRLSQLTPAGIAKLSETTAEQNVLFSAVTEEIRSTIKSMDDVDFIDGCRWYESANQFAHELAADFDTTPEIAAGVIAAVSPRMPWLRNKKVAEEVIFRFRNFDESLPATEVAQRMGLGLVSNFAMAIKIARGEDISNVLTGTKRRSFYNNIIAPNKGDSVTVDTWMVRALMRTTTMNLKTASGFLRANRVALGGTGVGYYVIAEGCRNVAETMNLKPCQVQACYWIAQAGGVNGGREDIS